MKLNVKDEIRFDELSEVIKEQFPEYFYRDTRKNTMIVGKSNTIGVGIFLRKKGTQLHIIGRFPTKGGFALYILVAILLGGVGAFIGFILFFQPKNDILEKEIANFLLNKYKDNITK